MEEEDEARRSECGRGQKLNESKKKDRRGTLSSAYETTSLKMSELLSAPPTSLPPNCPEVSPSKKETSFFH